MEKRIETEYDAGIAAMTVRMPKKITYTALTMWRRELLTRLTTREPEQDAVALFLDVNTHDFESIECLKLLRELLDDLVAKHVLSRVAFVTPVQFKEPGIRSPCEAYFETVADATTWLTSF